MNPINTTITQRIQESIAVKQALLEDHALLIQFARLAEDCLGALRQRGKIIFAGNGGSFADAQHLSAEFTSRFLFDRAPLPSLALGTNNSALRAIGNDYGFEQVFARELMGIAQPNNVFIGISASGNSLNVVAAVQVAKEIPLRQMAWTGQTGGKLADQCGACAL
jgi:D-sedoheptulose 7-phosphate isomerase